MAGNELIWFLIFVGVVVFLLVFLYSKKLTRRHKKRDAYQDALEAIIDGNIRIAMEKLKEAARENTDNLNAYLYLGNILRQQGLVKNAIKIHLELTYRRNLNEQERKRIYEALLLDYYELNAWEKVIETAKMLPSLMKNENLLLKTCFSFEQKQEWEDAFRFLDNLDIKSKLIKKRKALYKVFYGNTIAEEKSGHDARLIYKEALKIDPECAAAYFSIAQTYFEENRLDDAIEYLKKLALKVPDQSFYAFKPLEETYLAKNEFPKVQSFYEELIKKHPHVVYPYYALANLYLKKNELAKATNLLTEFKKDHPEYSKEIDKKLFGLFLQVGENEKAVKVAENLLQYSSTGFLSNLRCKNCDYTTNEPKWICPQCFSVMSFTV